MSLATCARRPPELMLEGQVSLALDAWSFGVLMWQLWTGERPFAPKPGAEGADVIQKILVEKASWVRIAMAAYSPKPNPTSRCCSRWSLRSPTAHRGTMSTCLADA